MPRRKRASSPFDPFDDDFDDDDCSQSSKNGNPPVQRNAANARERARMRVLSSAFGRLKTKLPNIPPDTKLSKLDTLRLATMYIKQLKVLVEGGGMNAENSDLLTSAEHAGIFAMQNVSQSMTWPFGFHHMQSGASSNGSSSSNRQMPLQCAPVDWSHSRNAYAKYGRICGTPNSGSSCGGSAGGSHYQQEQISHSGRWYTDEPMAEESVGSAPNNNCLYYDAHTMHQHKQSEHEMQQQQQQHTHQLHYQSPHQTGTQTIH